MTDERAIARRVDQVRARIAAAAQRCGRSPEDIRLIAVSKTFGPDAVRAALDAGVRELGENRAQELKEKAAVIPGGLWHFVGPLQTNKVRHVVGVAALIHSVDRVGLAEAVGRRARALGIRQDVLIEVNLAGEPSKHGAEPQQARHLARAVDAVEGVAVCGLMAIPPRGVSREDARSYFRDLALIREDIAGEIATCTDLSMGMSHDLEVAVEEGATMVRIGEAIFGPRNTPRARHLRIS